MTRLEGYDCRVPDKRQYKSGDVVCAPRILDAPISVKAPAANELPAAGRHAAVTLAHRGYRSVSRTWAARRTFQMQHRHHHGTLCRVEDAPLADAGDSRFTMRLRLEPVSSANAADLWLVNNDDQVWPWYGNEKPSLEQAEQWAKFMGDSWRSHDVHRWIAYDRLSGEVVGRGGLSRTPVDDDWGQIYAFLPAQPWVSVAHEIRRPFVAYANWLEIGWALRREFRGRGYASEIGRAGLAFAFDILGAQAVVSCTIRDNVRSRAVMERIGMRYAGEIRSRGIVEGVKGEQDDAPFAVCVLLRRDWQPSFATPGWHEEAPRGGRCQASIGQDTPLTESSRRSYFSQAAQPKLCCPERRSASWRRA
jgi:RimJ/RimL family protein N-acetyltransferase